MTTAAGKAMREIRNRLNIDCEEMADSLDMSVHRLHEIETGNGLVTDGTLKRFRDRCGVDPYVYAWCKEGDVNDLPEGMRQVAAKLMAGWDRQIAEAMGGSD